MNTTPQRQQIMTLVTEAVRAGACQARASALLGISARTLQRWQSAPNQADQRPLRMYEPANKLSLTERMQLLAVANIPEFADLPASQIVPRLADQGRYLASESTFYRLLKAAGQGSASTHRTPCHQAQQITCTQCQCP
jgi:putative transposase